MPVLTFHHVGCAVSSIDDSLRTYTQGMGFSRASRIVDVTSQNVRVCFVETAPGAFVELVQGLTADSPVSSFLKRRQYYYHVCYSTPDVRAAVERLEQHGFQSLSVFRSEAFSNAECAFLLSPEMALVELCTRGAFVLL